MPSTSSDLKDAFVPISLSDDRIDRLATLMGSVSELSLTLGTCMMEDNGERLMVSAYYCAHCNAIHGDDHDGEADCIHKRALALELAAEEQAREQLRAEYDAEQNDAWMVAVGVA